MTCHVIHVDVRDLTALFAQNNGCGRAAQEQRVLVGAEEVPAPVHGLASGIVFFSECDVHVLPVSCDVNSRRTHFVNARI